MIVHVICQWGALQLSINKLCSIFVFVVCCTNVLSWTCGMTDCSCDGVKKIELSSQIHRDD